MGQTIAQYGLFASLYSDRGSHYFLTPQAGGKVDKLRLTEVGRALKQLGIEHIAAYSPEARGHGGRLQAVQARRAVRGVGRPDAAPAFVGGQEQPGRHHQARRQLPAQPAHSGREVSGDDAHKRSDPISLWAAALRERVGWQKAAVALANKNARILWAVMTRGEAFNPRHVSVKPNAWTPANA